MKKFFTASCFGVGADYICRINEKYGKQNYRKTIKYFDDPQKWDQFCLSYRNKSKIEDYWCRIAREHAITRFTALCKDTGWKFYYLPEEYCLTGFHFRWNIGSCGKWSISVVSLLSDFVLWIDEDKYDCKHVLELLKTEKFKELINLFQEPEFGSGYFSVVESGKYYFDSPYDGKFDDEHLIWYAGNRPEEFVRQTEQKVEKFVKNPKIKGLIKDLNELTEIRLTKSQKFSKPEN